jgi:hypothetical protein
LDKAIRNRRSIGAVLEGGVFECGQCSSVHQVAQIRARERLSAIPKIRDVDRCFIITFVFQVPSDDGCP